MSDWLKFLFEFNITNMSNWNYGANNASFELASADEVVLVTSPNNERIAGNLGHCGEFYAIAPCF